MGPVKALAHGNSMLEVEFAHATDAGRVRDHNEDFIGCAVPQTPAQAHTHGWLFVLADGVGGQAFGEVASRTAVETVIAAFQQARGSEALSAVLQKAVQAANLAVYEAGRAASPGGTRMATTIAACALRHDRVSVAHVGDSRCYLIRHGRATPLTRDHTVVNEQLRLGVLSSREASQASTKHVLSRSLGTDLFVAADVTDHAVQPGDTLLLCSDGLHGAIPEADLARAAGVHTDLDAAANHLVAIAKERDGSDNISVVMIRVLNVEPMGMYRGRPYKLR